MRRVGIVGCGAIGSALAKVIERDHAHVARVVALHDGVPAAAEQLRRSLRARPAVCSLAQLIRRSDLVIEAAAASISWRVARAALAAGRDVLIMSTGGLLGRLPQLTRLAQRSSARLLLPSGALGGLDAVKALSMGRLRTVRLTTRKPPRALASAPLVRARRWRLERLTRPRTLFMGSPAETVRAFPQNTNVAATLALACAAGGAPAPALRICVVADPSLRTNVHELRAEGDGMRIQVRVESRPSRDNPKTSELAIRSAAVMLRQALGNVCVGT